MCETVRHHITEAVAGYEEKPRDQWIFDYPAQVALTSSQIWWTIDVGIAFDRLEEGFESALKDYNKKQVCIVSYSTMGFYAAVAIMSRKCKKQKYSQV